jgi:hypothetical protein
MISVAIGTTNESHGAGHEVDQAILIQRLRGRDCALATSSSTLPALDVSPLPFAGAIMRSRSRGVHGEACGLLLIVAASSCAVGRGHVDTEVRASKCLFERDPFVLESLMPWTTGGPTYADLSDARAYRNYMAVTAVWPVGHHFTASSQAGMADLRVERDPDGHLTIAREGGHHGDPDLAPPSISPIPPDVRPLADELEAELEAQCGSTLDLKLQYTGRNRSVIVAEFIAHDLDGSGTRCGGWKAAARVVMDDFDPDRWRCEGHQLVRLHRAPRDRAVACATAAEWRTEASAR